MITIFDVPKEIRDTISIKKINTSLELIVNSLQSQGVSEDEIREIISSKSFWIGLIEISKYAL